MTSVRVRLSRVWSRYCWKYVITRLWNTFLTKHSRYMFIQNGHHSNATKKLAPEVSRITINNTWYEVLMEKICIMCINKDKDYVLIIFREAILLWPAVLVRTDPGIREQGVSPHSFVIGGVVWYNSWSLSWILIITVNLNYYCCISTKPRSLIRTKN